MEYTTESSEETKRLGEEFGTSLKGGEIVALSGELGAGKTTFVQGLAQALHVKTRVLSPTFILMRTYEGNKHALYHLDLYRLEGNMFLQLDDLGLREIMQDDNNIIVVEWAEKAKNYFPENTIWISFAAAQDAHKITITR